MKNLYKLFVLFSAISVLLSACGGSARTETSSSAAGLPEGKLVEYSLLSTMLDGQMAFVGVGGGIDGVKNPTLSANVGDLVRVTLTGGDTVEHDVAFERVRPDDVVVVGVTIAPDQSSGLIDTSGDRTEADAQIYVHRCDVIDHRDGKSIAGRVGVGLREHVASLR